MNEKSLRELSNSVNQDFTSLFLQRDIFTYPNMSTKYNFQLIKLIIELIPTKKLEGDSINIVSKIIMPETEEVTKKKTKEDLIFHDKIDDLHNLYYNIF